jgi:hypothetical protein
MGVAVHKLAINDGRNLVDPIAEQESAVEYGDFRFCGGDVIAIDINHA